MFIASKYEDIYPPPVLDFVYICDHAYSVEQIFQMEVSVLTTLSFSITSCTPYRFLERFFNISPHGSQRLWNLARYLIELPLIE